MKPARTFAGFRVVVAENIEDLSPFLKDLEDLASATAEPNIFYEPCMLVPAMRWLAEGTDLRLVLVFLRGKNAVQEQLGGFFPLEVLRYYNHFPVKTARLWRHKFCHLCTPLLRHGKERAVLAAFFDWSATHSEDWRIVEFGWNTGSGVLHELLVESSSFDQRVGLVDTRYTRPLLRCALTAETYFKDAISSKHLKDIQKKQRKLQQLGTVEYATPVSTEEAGEWINEFIRLEAAGWKRQRGDTIAANTNHVHFFRDAMEEVWQAGKLDLIALRLDSKLIAIKINLLCHIGAFAVRISFDESYRAYSPGLLLELENIRRFHQRPGIQWMDSCADQYNPMFNRIWSEKRVIESLLISNESRIGDAWIGIIPLGHWLRRTFFGTHACESVSSASNATYCARDVDSPASVEKPLSELVEG